MIFVCVTCHRVSSDSRGPYEWVMSTVSCPQQPCSVPVHLGIWLLLWSPSISYLAFSFSAVFYFSQPIVSSKELSLLRMWPMLESFSILSFLPPAMFQAYFAVGPTCSSFWQSRVSIELSSNTLFQINRVFFWSAFFTVQLPHPYIVIGNTRVWMILALISNDTSLLLMIFLFIPLLFFQVSAFF